MTRDLDYFRALLLTIAARPSKSVGQLPPRLTMHLNLLRESGFITITTAGQEAVGIFGDDRAWDDAQALMTTKEVSLSFGMMGDVIRRLGKPQQL